MASRRVREPLRFLLLLGVAAITVAAAAAFSALAAVGLAVGWLLALAGRYDNHTGSCLVITILFVIVLGVLAFLVGLAAIPRP